MTKEKLFQLYSLARQEEQYYSSEHQHRVAFYVGLISTLIGITVLGVYQATEFYQCVFLTVSPITIIIVSDIATKGTTRMYQRFLETLTMIFKIEEDLGMTTQRKEDGTNWISSEPYVTKRHLDSRKGFNSSKDWVDHHLKIKDSYHSVTVKLFWSTKILGCAMLILIGALAVLKF